MKGAQCTPLAEVRRPEAADRVQAVPVRVKDQARRDEIWGPGGPQGFGNHIRQFGLHPLDYGAGVF